MASSNYRRVSRKRVCRICDKPDWCSYTPDEKISFCAREISGANRVSRTGWGVFYHENFLFNDSEPPFPFPRSKPSAPKPELASIEIRDFVYRKLIELAPATNSKEIIDGEKGLRARKILDFENYGSLPQTNAERRELAKEIRRLVNLKFSDFVRQRKSSVAGLPGFWLDKEGKIQLWTDKDYSCPMLLIPYRAANGFIQACQIRFMCRRLMTDGVRYVWLSTPEKSEGLSCGSPVHFASRGALFSGKPFLVTEGVLKAETAQVFMSDCDVLATAGVGCSHDEIVAATQNREVIVAFDTDYYENPYVARACSKLINSISAAAKPGFQHKTRILTWNPKIKGIDDALMQNAATVFQTPFEWYKSLNGICQSEVFDFLQNTLAAAV